MNSYHDEKDAPAISTDWMDRKRHYLWFFFIECVCVVLLAGFLGFCAYIARN